MADEENKEPGADEGGQEPAEPETTEGEQEQLEEAKQGETADDQLESRVEALEQRVAELSEAFATISTISEDEDDGNPDPEGDSEYGEALDLDQLLGL